MSDCRAHSMKRHDCYYLLLIGQLSSLLYLAIWAMENTHDFKIFVVITMQTTRYYDSFAKMF